jgi:dienelactone hydrolase
MRRRRRIVGLTLGVLLTAVALSIALLLRDPMPHFQARRSSLAMVAESPSVVEEGYALTNVRLTATSGLSLELMIRRSVVDTGAGRLPLAVILGGHYTGRQAARMLGETPGVVVAAMSYPYEGNPKPDALTFLRDIPRIRKAFLDTPPAVMLAIDYLRSRPDVDTTAVEAIGVSLGAPFICVAGALDKRITRVWALHGSGGSYTPLQANMKRAIPFGPLRAVAAGVANVIINGPRLDPVRWVGDISPRPFIMVNASADERLPRPAIDALFNAAREPKELVWMSGLHVHADRETIGRLVSIVMERVRSRPVRR